MSVVDKLLCNNNENFPLCFALAAPPLSFPRCPLGGPPGCRGQPLALDLLYPLSPSLQPEEKRHVEAPVWTPCAARAALRRVSLSYLSDRLFVPHGRLLHQAVDFYIPISARNDHPGPPETHRHFHFSLGCVNSNEEKAALKRQQPSPVSRRLETQKIKLKSPAVVKRSCPPPRVLVLLGEH